MNRVTVVVFALVVLLAHTVAIHQTSSGELAPPYDQAHVAYRIGRNFVHLGLARWSVEGPWIESYPSPLWVLVAAAAEFRYVPPTIFTQWVGVLCTLTTIIVLAQFSPRRIAGLIAPMLLALSGTVAAAAASGTEAPLALILITASFLAFDRRRKRMLAVLLSALILTRPEGTAFAAAMFVVLLLDRGRGADGTPRTSLRSAFVLPFAAAVALALFRWNATGSPFSPFESALVQLAPERWALGADYVRSFLVSSGSGALIAFPILALCTGSLSVVGRRALALTVVWMLVVLLSGGNRLPFWNALAPVLALLFLAVQETLRGWMDRRPAAARLAWALLILSAGASLLVSKVPSRIGPLQVEALHRSWMRPSERLANAYEHQLGRLGLIAEISEVERLRALGVFLRQELEPDATVLTFWPGAVGYLSRRTVRDVQRRAYVQPGQGSLSSWYGVPRVDLARELEDEADYIVPSLGFADDDPATFLPTWLATYDSIGSGPERVGRVRRALEHYELVSVPVPEKAIRPNVPATKPFLLLRNKDLELGPVLELQREGQGFQVLVSHTGHEQVVDVTVRARDGDGRLWSMRPTGEWAESSEIVARVGILLYDTGKRPIHLVAGVPPSELEIRDLVILLSSPGIDPASPLAAVTELAVPY